MMRIFARVIVMILILGALIPFTSHQLEAGAGQWAGGNSSKWNIMRTCRDGGEIEIIHNSSTTEEPVLGREYIIEVFVKPRFFTRPFDESILDDNDLFDLDVDMAEFYPRIGPNQRFYSQTSNYSSIPYRADISGSGTERSYYQHLVGNVYFTQNMPVGSTVLFDAHMLRIVEDCYLGDISVVQGNEAVELEVNRISAGYDYIPADRLNYQITTAPAQGDLSLGDALLAEGGSFTQTDLLGDQFRYRANTLAETDVFSYTARATFRASINSNGEEATGGPENSQFQSGGSSQPSISPNGAAIAFTSQSTNLFVKDGTIIPDENNATDVFVRSLFSEGGRTTAVSAVPSNDALGNGASSQPDIEQNGATVVYSSLANNLLFDSDPCEDTNNASDIFVFRGAGRTTELVSNFSDCQQFNANSATPSISSKMGVNIVAYHTSADLPGTLANDTNANADVVISAQRSVQTAQSTRRVADELQTGDAGSFVGALSADSDWLAYETDASDLAVEPGPLDTNGETDVMIREVVQTFFVGVEPHTPSTRVSVTSNNEQATGGGSFLPAISRFGNHIAFESEATNLMSGHNGVRQVYVHDRQVVEDGLREQGCTMPISLNSEGSPGNFESKRASISANGRFIAFESLASNLVADDTNGVRDIFVVDRDSDQDYSFYSDATHCVAGPSRIFRVSVHSDGTQANGASTDPDVSGNGDFVAFASAATNLVADDTNNMDDIFIHYMGFTGQIRLQPEPLVFQHQIYIPIFAQ